jgi:O-antigen/teichoic acid export membrane protein
MNLKHKVKTSLIWSFSDQIITQFVFVVFGIFLARLIPPSTFGIISMVTMFSNFAILFIDMGFGTALIQKKDADHVHYSSVFWLNLTIGCALYVLFFFAAPLLSWFFNQPQLTLLVRVICLSFIINSLTAVQSNLLIKELKFKQKVIFNWISMVIGYSIAFYLAIYNFGVWAIVWMTLITSISNSLLFWFSTKWYPSFVYDKSKIKELSHFGLNVLGDTSINYWSRNFDNFIIAKVLGSTELGIYTRAYSLMLLPLKNISSVITKVLFPAFSKKQDDIPSIKRYYLLIIKYVSLLTFPAMIGLSLVSKEFVLLFFGENWRSMIPVLSILSIVGAVQSIFTLNGMIYNSLGKANIAFKVSLLVNFVLIIAFSIGVNFGIVGMAWSYLIACIILFFPIYNTAIKQINTTLIEAFATLKSPIIATLFMAIVLLVLNYYLQTPDLKSLIIKIGSGAIIYIILIYFLEKELLFSISNTIKSSLKKANFVRS